MSAWPIDMCATCGSGDLTSVLSLGASPPTCVMVPVGETPAMEAHYPLELLRCEACSLVQLSVIVDPLVVFPPEYPYSSGNSLALHANFADLAAQVTRVRPLERNDLVVDIGANDGTLLSKFHDCQRVAVEPTAQIERWRLQGNAGYKAFFSTALAKQIRAERGPAQVITACNVLAHVADVADVMEGIEYLLDEDGVLVAENHDVQSVVAGQWDTVYHEHLRYYSPYSFHRLLVAHGLAGRAWAPIATHGGSFRMMAVKATRSTSVLPPAREDHDFAPVAAGAVLAREAIRAAATRGIWGIGATARATTLINYCGLDVEDMVCVAEVPTSDKIGHYIPGTRIPVVDEAPLFEEGLPISRLRSMLLSWHLADDIVPSLRRRGYHGAVVVPLPDLHVRPF